MSCLYILGRAGSFRSCRALCHISTSAVRLFYHRFLDTFMETKDDYGNIHELSRVASHYNAVGLPGACGSMDVVHIKWATCPAGDHNRAKGTEGYPTLGVQCITDYNRIIIAMYGPQFGTRNDKDIVKHDPNVMEIRDGWLGDCQWKYYAEDGRVLVQKGMYLICDNGYLRWPVSICPFTHVGAASPEGYFSANLESVRKDVECTFGILKKWWRILNYGFQSHNMSV
jgi:hypothetical protein